MKTPFITLILVLISIFVIGCGDDTSSRAPWGWTNALEFGRMPRWSPDGNTILFGDDRVGQPGLYFWEPGDDPHPLNESLPPHNWDYCWSPGGDMIAFSAPGAPDDSCKGLWIVDAATGVAEKILPYGKDVSWYYDGASVFARFNNPPDGNPGIYQVILQTRETVWLNLDGFMPKCSPVGDYIAFCTDEIRGQLALADINGLIGQFPCDGLSQFAWSSDGTCVGAIINDYTDGIENGILWRIRIVEGELHGDSLTGWTAYPAVNQDGSEIAFIRTSAANWRGLWIYRSDGNEGRIATYGLNPDFDPDGNRIAVNGTDGGIRILTRGM